MQISDFPKGNHTEFLSLITLATIPPIVCHGKGSSLEESRDEAAIHVLELLTKMGFDNIRTDSKTTDDSVVSEDTNVGDDQAADD